jgi:hypothetical protein
MEYKQLKLRSELHIRIKTLAAKSGMTVNDYLDKLTSYQDEVVQPQKQ